MKLVNRLLLSFVLIVTFSCSSDDASDNPDNGVTLKLLKSYTR